MPNMHYCRFQNTLNDLRECEAALDDNEELSSEESRAKEELLLLCQRIAEDYLEMD